ncbi:helix-turn-helix domain-containing protein [Taibaiella koreensis]|uniref:helix-turn-helix domain-containing protein n=1 Tax=Taibaiella koreensis TaxID=1268548 RepID=UPI000E59D716
MCEKEIGLAISLRREKLALNQADLAEMAGVAIRTVYMIENGKGNPSLNTLQKVMNVLGLELTIGIKQIRQ